MGAGQSSAKCFWIAARALRDLHDQFNDVVKRASERPGFPVPDPTTSTVLEDPPVPQIAYAQMALPSNRADVVIIGSGITAAAIAHSILNECDLRGRRLRVAVFESRSICGGATGRSGGHMKSSPHELFATLRKTHSIERALQITKFQLAHARLLLDMCRKKNWTMYVETDFLFQTADFYLTDEDRDEAFEKVVQIRKYIPDLKIEMWEAFDAQKYFNVNEHVKGAISYFAAVIDPYRFVICVWNELLHRFKYFLYLQTNSSVLSVRETQNSEYAYEVVTSNGTTLCNHVIHATNAFASELVPGLRGKLTGYLSTMTAQRPGQRFPNQRGYRSWSVVHGRKRDHITQQPWTEGAQGDLLVGGGFSRSDVDLLNSLGVWDDSRVDALPVAHLGGIFPTMFEPLWGDDAAGGRTKHAWSGIMSVTGDALPFVGWLDPELTGRKPDLTKNIAVKRGGGVRPGEWVAAGYGGEGMVWAWLCGTAVGIMVAGTQAQDAMPYPGRPVGPLARWFPPELLPTKERLKEAGLENLTNRFFHVFRGGDMEAEENTSASASMTASAESSSGYDDYEWDPDSESEPYVLSDDEGPEVKAKL
ncbi:FAD dependent oxidoreductase-domain-containing protein [Hypoxylon crocopeplum]|nr:FAD dependent oxidoreductase-domain-containing protein [Hypoxylon crocopeplum]